jgi:regulator of sigma D
MENLFDKLTNVNFVVLDNTWKMNSNEYEIKTGIDNVPKFFTMFFQKKLDKMLDDARKENFDSHLLRRYVASGKFNIFEHNFAEFQQNPAIKDDKLEEKLLPLVENRIEAAVHRIDGADEVFYAGDEVYEDEANLNK